MREVYFIKKDCYAYKEQREKRLCKVCKKLYCEKGHCPFYKTKEEFEKAEMLAKLRLMKLTGVKKECKQC